MDNLISLLDAVYSTMNTISVEGIDNQDKFVGCANALQRVIKQLREQAASQDSSQKETVNDG